MSKKMNTNSNAYIIIYSAVLVIVVAFLLAFIFQALKPMQDENVELDRQKQVLYSLNIRNLDGAEAKAKYQEVVKEETTLAGHQAYLCKIEGEDVVVVPVKGMGLWGGISGFVALHTDADGEWTVYGVYYNHDSETAGLGAEIKDSQTWQEKFIGKKVFRDGKVVLSVVKKVEDPATQVDVVTGATLTSNGVDAMLKEGLQFIYSEEAQARLGKPAAEVQPESAQPEAEPAAEAVQPVETTSPENTVN